MECVLRCTKKEIKDEENSKDIRRKETLKIIEQDNKKELEKDMDFDDKVKEMGLLMFGWRKVLWNIRLWS